MNEDDLALLDTIRNEGIGVMRGVLSGEEVEAVRVAFDRAHEDASGKPGVRDRLKGEPLLKYPSLAALYSHPRILAVVSAVLDEPVPWVWQVITNRYTPEHEGVRRHTDGILGEWAPPFTRQSMAVFLDDIDETSGSLMYVPGTHRRHFEPANGDDRPMPTQADVDAGDYVPTRVSAGDVVFRVPEVWHYVIPIHRLRRYVTASYTTRGRLSPAMTERTRQEAERRAATSLDAVPERLRPHWHYG